MSWAPDVSTVNEALARRDASALGNQIPFEIGSPDAASLADEITSPMCHR